MFDSLTDLNLEKKIVSALASDADLIPDAMAKIRPEHFTDSFCRSVFELIGRMYREGLAVDVLTVADRGKGLFLGQGVSWLQSEYILPSTFNYFADKLIRQHRQQKLHELGKTILSEVAADTEPDTIAGTVEKSLFEITTEKELALIEQ